MHAKELMEERRTSTCSVTFDEDNSSRLGLITGGLYF
jgi:hypothetical protein